MSRTEDIQSPEPDEATGLLAELLGAIERGEPVPLSAGAWFRFGVTRAVRRGEPLEAGLGLVRHKGPSLQRRVITMRRDEHLLRALELVACDVDVSTWQRCTRLAPLLKSFEARTWPMVRARLDPPVDWPAWRREVFFAAQHAERLELPLPSSRTSLYRLARDAGLPWQRRPLTVLTGLL